MSLSSKFNPTKTVISRKVCDVMTEGEHKPTVEELADAWIQELVGLAGSENRLRMVIDLNKTGERSWDVSLAYTCSGLSMGVGVYSIVAHVIENLEKRGYLSSDIEPWKDLQRCIGEKLGPELPMTLTAKRFAPFLKKEPLTRFDDIISTVSSE